MTHAAKCLPVGDGTMPTARLHCVDALAAKEARVLVRWLAARYASSGRDDGLIGGGVMPERLGGILPRRRG